MSILRRLEISTATSSELNRASGILESIFDLLKKYASQKRRLMRDIEVTKIDLKNAENERVDLNNFLRTIPDQEEISHSIEQREICERQINNEQQKIGREMYILEQCKKNAEAAQTALEKALASSGRMGLYKRQLDFCKKSIRILNETKEEILNECRQEMQKETFEIFDRLVWKKGAFSKVNILDDYSFELLDEYGEQTLGSCSAAERALLALSFTIALQQTSGHDSLLYIDTPLGRVGDKNRVNFMQVLLDVADTKQVILSFTPTEYDANVRSQLDKQYSSYCELYFNDGTTTIKR